MVQLYTVTRNRPATEGFPLAATYFFHAESTSSSGIGRKPLATQVSTHDARHRMSLCLPATRGPVPLRMRFRKLSTLSLARSAASFGLSQGSNALGSIDDIGVPVIGDSRSHVIGGGR